MSKWTRKDIPNLNGKNVIVTGANNGLGLLATKILSEKGATIIMACRNTEKAEDAKNEIIKENSKANLKVMHLDNADLSSVKSFSEEFKREYNKLDILFNNAGVMAIPRSETKDGFEMQFGVNHLAHFALTGHLIDILTSTEGSKVHTTSSSAAFSAKINFEDLMGKENYTRWDAYNQSKLANAIFAKELNIRLKKAGFSTTSNSSHPGVVMTNLQKNSLSQSGKPKLEIILYNLLGPIFGQSISMGVLPMLYATTSESAEGGKFYGPRILRLRGYPTEQFVNELVDDKETREKLWEVSEELTGVSYL